MRKTGVACNTKSSLRVLHLWNIAKLFSSSQ